MLHRPVKHADILLPFLISRGIYHKTKSTRAAKSSRCYSYHAQDQSAIMPTMRQPKRLLNQISSNPDDRVYERQYR